MLSESTLQAGHNAAINRAHRILRLVSAFHSLRKADIEDVHGDSFLQTICPVIVSALVEDAKRSDSERKAVIAASKTFATFCVGPVSGWPLEWPRNAHQALSVLCDRVISGLEWTRSSKYWPSIEQLSSDVLPTRSDRANWQAMRRLAASKRLRSMLMSLYDEDDDSDIEYPLASANNRFPRFAQLVSVLENAADEELKSALEQMAPANRHDKRTDVVKPRPSHRKEGILRALFQEKAFDFERRLTSERIAELAEPNANPAGFKTPLTQLKHAELLDSQRNRGGGYWLTKKGKNLAKHYR